MAKTTTNIHWLQMDVHPYGIRPDDDYFAESIATAMQLPQLSYVDPDPIRNATEKVLFAHGEFPSMKGGADAPVTSLLERALTETHGDRPDGVGRKRNRAAMGLGDTGQQSISSLAASSHSRQPWHRSPLLQLPDDVTLNILGCLDGQSLLSGVAASSRRLLVLSHYNDLWRALVLPRWGGAFCRPDEWTGNWRDAFVASITRDRGIPAAYRAHAPRMLAHSGSGSGPGCSLTSSLLYKQWQCANMPIRPLPPGLPPAVFPGSVGGGDRDGTTCPNETLPLHTEGEGEGEGEGEQKKPDRECIDMHNDEYEYEYEDICSSAPAKRARQEEGDGVGEGSSRGQLPPPWLQGGDTVPVEEASTVSIERFAANYEARNFPVLLRGATKDWPALQKWARPGYLERSAEPEATARPGEEVPQFVAGGIRFTMREYMSYCMAAGQGSEDGTGRGGPPRAAPAGSGTPAAVSRSAGAAPKPPMVPAYPVADGAAHFDDQHMYLFDREFATKAPPLVGDLRTPRVFAKERDAFALLEGEGEGEG